MNLDELRKMHDSLQNEAGKVLVGLEQTFGMLLVALFSRGHVLVEGVPGTAKTLMAKTLAHMIQAQFTRVQFTPDLMPSDVLGTSVFDLRTARFHLKKGPIFTQILLADEINRAPAKTQAALLEAMEERQVNLEGERHVLKSPFMVMATQNPIEYEGTYPLPEAQLDRFMFKLVIPLPPQEVDVEVLRRYHEGFNAHDLEGAGLRGVLPAEAIEAAQTAILGVLVEPGIMDYVAKVVHASRRSPDLLHGASTRAAVHILLASKTFAALRGREYVTPDDVKRVVTPVLRHRIVLKPETEIEGLDADAVIQRLLGQVEVPR